MNTLTIAVIMGGPSAEADVSRSSAAEVAAALTSIGHRVTCFELNSKLAETLAGQRPDVVFPVLHGPPGEDGTVQGFLEILELPYVGGGVHASAVAMDKALSKTSFRSLQLPVATDVSVAADEPLEQAKARILETLGARVVVKPNGQGSAIGVTRVEVAEQLIEALMEVKALGSGALVEPYVIGKEITVGILDLHNEVEKIFPVIEVVTAPGEWYDFHNRYAKGKSQHIVPAELSATTSEELQRIALAAHRVLGLRDLSRSDFIVDAQENIVLLETNSLPGMTPTSLYPDGAAAIGLDFPSLMDALVRSAYERGHLPGG